MLYLGFLLSHSLALERRVSGDVTIFKIRKKTRCFLHEHHVGVVLTACGAAELRASSFVFLPLAAFISAVIETQRYRVLDKVLNSCVIFFQNKTSGANNSFTTSSPPRAPHASLLCGCLLITNLTPQNKGNRPCPNP